jgi:translation initiation factor 1
MSELPKKPITLDATDFFRSKSSNGGAAVFATDQGDLRKNDKPSAREIASGKSIKVRRESKGRGGKSVMVIEGLPLNDAELQSLCSELKRGLGVGGSVVGAMIEIQGEARDALLRLLQSKGFAAKSAGG